MTLLETIELNPSEQPIATIIWLHGLGADGNDFVPIIEALQLPKSLPLRFIFPNAPLQPVTINNGYVMRAWYDIISLQVDNHADEKGIAHSISAIQALIANEETRGVPSERIFLAGFSQGAVIALMTALTFPQKLAGVIALSGYLPFVGSFFTQLTAINKNIPILLAHGTNDNVVPFFLGKATQNTLMKYDYAVEWHEYTMPHSVCPEEIADISQWLQRQLMN